MPKNPWKKYQLLSSWKTESSSANIIVKILSQLELTLDILAEETLQVCSLLKPLSDQLLLFLPEEGEHSNISCFIRNELKTSIQQNEFLIMASFFDPRFQSSLSFEERSMTNQNILSSISLEHNVELEEYGRPERRSSLKMLFNRGKTTTDTECPPPKIRKTNINEELSSYSSETPLDVEFCPLDWWTEYTSKYKLLSKSSSKYFTVPCFYRSDIKLKVTDIVDLDEKKFKLDDKYFSNIWFLHNENK